jgi:hypothetical protein
MKHYVAIDKYGLFYDPETDEICPMNADGTPDTNEGVRKHLHEHECAEELNEAIHTEIMRVMGDM